MLFLKKLILKDKKREHLHNIFMQVRDYCYKNNISNFQTISVETDFIKADFIYENKNQSSIKNDFAWYHRDFYDYNIYDSSRYLDFSFLERFNIFVIENIEEYTFNIIEVILAKFPNKKILSLDEKVKELFLSNEVGYLENIEDLFLLDVGKICYIHSHDWIFDNIGSKGIDGYNSKYVFQSLIWMQYIEHLGEKNQDKIIYIIDYATDDAGLMDIIKYTAAHVVLARKRKWIPVIYLNRQPNQYLEAKNDNMWEYFFEPASKITYENAMQSANVIRASNNYIQLNDTGGNVYFNECSQEIYSSILSIDNWLFSGIVKLTPTAVNLLEGMIPKTFKDNNKILGVICRGTDYSTEANKNIGRIHFNASVEYMLCVTEKMLKKYNYQYIFLATEDSTYLKLFKDKFGDKLLYLEQKRVTYDYKNNPYKPVSELLDIKNGKQFATQYLAVLYTLSRCDSLISSIYCGAYQGAVAFSDHVFEYSSIIREQNIN